MSPSDTLDEFIPAGARWTVREIAQQPAVWARVQALVAAQIGPREMSPEFIARCLATPNLRIVLTGAGSSAFIGQCLAPALMRKTGLRVDAVATTDLVAGPHLYFQREVPTLLVSFARSGSSPESAAALVLADQFVDDCQHLVFTCNPDSLLQRLAAERGHARTLMLPAETHDRSFAMTSSFTSLLLAAAQVFGLLAPADAQALSTAASAVLAQGLMLAEQLVEQRFERVVYLGSNELQGLAREAALKLLELSDGCTVASHDSPLGFRHGPKTIVNDRTLVVMFVSNDPYTRQYDLDLLHELRRDGRAARVLALSAQPLQGACASPANDVLLEGLADATDLALAFPCIVFAQRFALLQSLRLGLSPDNPSVSGTVSRVVRGVTIHPFPDAEIDPDVPRH
ncbi:MAG TPA: SIS domain-containing protein [Ideonella sp.]|uniref:SIS domain-containing protein n=1 Tax=Ideonella sp. TaxID=1929293 RepID=UPI002E334670|nr:SIS domain-containing protein [Ideonella sp.]HEX5685744.1 SIS domain-containing protein [Ideonella sp.]